MSAHTGVAAAHAPFRTALVLYGRVGTFTRRSASMKQGDLGDARLWRMCADSIHERVVEPWRRAGIVDVFVQSWNPELSALMDGFWTPRASLHAAQNGTAHKRCPARLMLCERTQWALLGMKSALQLRSRWAGANGGSRMHSTVLMMRHDVYWYTQLPVVRADRAVRLWLPFDCQRSPCKPPRSHPPGRCAPKPESARGIRTTWRAVCARRRRVHVARVITATTTRASTWQV